MKQTISGMANQLLQWRVVAGQSGIANIEQMSDTIFTQEAVDALTSQVDQ